MIALSTYTPKPQNPQPFECQPKKALGPRALRPRWHWAQMSPASRNATAEYLEAVFATGFPLRPELEGASSPLKQSLNPKPSDSDIHSGARDGLRALAVETSGV